MIPSSYRLLYSRKQIEERVHHLGADISAWASEIAKNTRSEVITMPLLSGGIFFYADLVRSLTCSVDLSPIRVRAYLSNELQQSVQVAFDDVEVATRSLLLIDDICDSGRTLKLVTHKMQELGAREIRSVVLVKREVPGEIEPTWCGFRYSGTEWLVGYGMDDNERYRNLPDIYRIEIK